MQLPISNYILCEIWLFRTSAEQAELETKEQNYFLQAYLRIIDGTFCVSPYILGIIWWMYKYKCIEFSSWRLISFNDFFQNTQACSQGANAELLWFLPVSRLSVWLQLLRKRMRGSIQSSSKVFRICLSHCFLVSYCIRVRKLLT